MYAVIDAQVTDQAAEDKTNSQTGEVYTDRRVWLLVNGGREIISGRVADDVVLPEPGTVVRAVVEISAYLHTYRGEKSARLAVRVADLIAVEAADVPARAV